MSFSTAISGINTASKDLSVIGNNISNASTTGFKMSRSEFADIYASGGSGAYSIGNGVRLARVQQTFGQGNFTYTDNSLDLAISGSGFFLLSDQGTRIFSRAGSFTLNDEGYIVNNLEQRLVGLVADEDGDITSLSGDMKIDKSNIRPKPTSEIEMGLNLLANSTPPTEAWAGGVAPATNTYNNITSTPVYDSLGNSHILSLYFIRADADAAAGTANAATPAGTKNQWYVAFQLDNKDVPALTGTTNSANLFRINFNSDGTFGGVQNPAGDPLAGSLIPLTMNLINGADPLNVSFDLSKTTQFGSQFALQNSVQNGFTTGRLDGLEIDNDGVLYGRYTNNQTRAMGQILLADFNNVNGLRNLNNTAWAETSSSGQALISKPNTASLGLIQSGAVEDSNVDLTSELVKLIGAERNFKANAQTIKTEDAITQTIINIR